MSLVAVFDQAMENLENAEIGALMVELCKAWDAAEDTSSQDERRFLAILQLLLGYADHNARLTLSGFVLKAEGLPADVRLYMACDEITIAAPFLEPEFELADDDIKHIAEFCSKDHRIALLRREGLSKDVIFEIMRHNEPEVIQAMNKKPETAIFYEYDDSFTENAQDDLILEGYDYDIDIGEDAESPFNLMIQGFVTRSRFADMIETLARQSKLPKDMVKTMFMRKEAEGFSILCRGLEMSNETFAEVARFRCRRLGQLERLGDQVAEEYKDISADYAAAMLRDLQGQAGNISTLRAIA